MEEVLSKSRFFAVIGRERYAMEFREEQDAFRCGSCGGRALTCDATPIHGERAERIRFEPDIALDEFRHRDGEREFVVCGSCGRWSGDIDTVQVDTSEVDLSYEFVVSGREISLPADLCDAIELVFWKDEIHAGHILQKCIFGESEYAKRLIDGLQDVEIGQLVRALTKAGFPAR